MVNGLFHTPNTLLSTANQVFVSNDLVNELVLTHAIDLFLCIGYIIFPLAEVALQRMVHRVDNKASSLLHAFTLHNKFPPTVECFRDDVEFTIFEEK